MDALKPSQTDNVDAEGEPGGLLRAHNRLLAARQNHDQLEEAAAMREIVQLLKPVLARLAEEEPPYGWGSQIPKES